MKLDIQRFASTKSTSFSESNLSTQTNTSSLTITAKFSANNSVTYFSGKTLYCTCNGVTKSSSVSLSKGGSVTKSFTFDNIAHNTDGTKTVAWAWNCNTGTSALGNISASGNRTLTTINRQSMFDTTGWDQDIPVLLTDSIEFTINQYLPDVYHKLTMYIYENDQLNQVAVRSNITITNNKYSFVFTASELENNVYPLITNSSTKYIRAYLQTYTDSELTEQLGDDSIIWYTGEIPSTLIPSVSIGTLTEADITMQSLNWGVFVQNKSKLNIPITATGVYGSTIQSIVTTINGISFTGTPVVTSTLVTAGTNTITTTVTDSRGRTATDTTTYSVETYSNPNIQIAQAQRCLSDGTLSDNGTYLLYDFTGTISSVANNNVAQYRIGYKKTTDSSYTYVNISNNYTINLTDIVSSFTISDDYPYDIKFEAIDSFMTASIDRDIDTGFDLLNFNASGKAMAIGKVSEAGANEELLEVKLPTEFLDTVDMGNVTTGDITSADIDATGNITASGDISGDAVVGTSGSFGTLTLASEQISDFIVEKGGTYATNYYIKYASGIMIQYGRFEVTSALTTALGNVYRTASTVGINLAESFVDTNYVITTTANAAINSFYINPSDKTESSFKGFPIAYVSTTSATRYIDFIAIGRWQ